MASRRRQEFMNCWWSQLMFTHHFPASSSPWKFSPCPGVCKSHFTEAPALLSGHSPLCSSGVLFLCSRAPLQNHLHVSFYRVEPFFNKINIPFHSFDLRCPEIVLLNEMVFWNDWMFFQLNWDGEMLAKICISGFNELIYVVPRTVPSPWCGLLVLFFYCIL